MLIPPPSYPKAIERRIPFEDFLDKSIGFINPTNVVHLCSELGLDAAGSSLMESLDGEFSLRSSVSDPYSSNPDPAKNLNPDPDPGRP